MSSIIGLSDRISETLNESIVKLKQRMRKRGERGELWKSVGSMNRHWLPIRPILYNKTWVELSWAHWRSIKLLLLLSPFVISSGNSSVRQRHRRQCELPFTLCNEAINWIKYQYWRTDSRVTDRRADIETQRHWPVIARSSQGVISALFQCRLTYNFQL